MHLLLQDFAGNTRLFMKKFGVSYAGYYNRKYDRVGHLFQDRHKSEVITDDVYLLSVHLYILKNTEKAGIADTRLLTSMIGNDAKFEAFLAEADQNEYMEYAPRKHDDE